MGLYWNWYALTGLLAWAFAWSMAVFVYAAAPRRTVNRFLAVALLLEGALWFGGNGLLYLVDHVPTASGLQIMGWSAGLATQGAYLLFLSEALDTPITRPLRRPLVRVLVVGVLLGQIAYMLVRTGDLLAGIGSTWYARNESIDTGLTLPFMLLPLGLTALYGLVASIWAYATAPTATARIRARAFLTAFGVRDAAMAGILFSAFFLRDRVAVGSRWWDVDTSIVMPSAALVYLPLLAYGILRSNLFDIEVRIQWTLRQSTVAAVFLGVFFVVSQLAEALASQYVGPFGWVLGAVAAGLLLFALTPIQRLAERLARASMPGVRPTEAYLTYRKHEVYKETVEALLVDGTITEKERGALERLRDRLGIHSADASALERDVKARLTGAIAAGPA